MRFCYMYFLGVILYYRFYQIDAKTSREETFPSDNSKLQCSTGQDMAQMQSDSYDGQQHFRNEEKNAIEPNEFAEKRSINEISSSKKQVGVIYKNDNPIGILQPAQRSYRFIPVEDNSFGFDKLEGGKALAYNVPEISEIKKRQAEGIHHYDNYPSILTNFKIGTKLDQKRNQDIAAETLNDLNSGTRKQRSSNMQNEEHIEDELKNVLDDMGLIEENEKTPEKREIADSDLEVDEEEDEEINKVKNKRNKDCIDEPVEQSEQMHPNHNHEIMDDNELKHQTMYQPSIEKRDEINGVNRYKQNALSQSNAENLEDTEELSDFDNSIQTEHKLSLPSRSARNTDNDANEKVTDYDRTIEHQIQTKIDALKEEVKREIKLVKAEQDEDDSQRKKRQITNNLIDEETEDIDPALNPDTDLKTQIRRKRAVSDVLGKTKHSHSQRLIRPHLKNTYAVRKKRNQSKLRNSEDVLNLFEDNKKEDGLTSKRNTFPISRDNLKNILADNKASPSSSNEQLINYLPQNIYNKHDKVMRQIDGNSDTNTKSKFVDNIKTSYLSSRFRRRINEKGVDSNRPQQLSDMSDFDIFGALPKSYEGELSRYKRVKRE